ncbi:MAG: DUF1893 domain-containing protein [Clostridiales bacterium]|nr:DUF1893 domain-containing protein [Clostridiales bacterium]
MNSLTNAKKLLSKRNAEFVVVCDEAVHISYEKGICPILNWLKKDRDFFNGATVADRSLGLAHAYLLAFGGVQKVYASSISPAAAKVLDQYGIEYEFGVQHQHVPGCGAHDLCMAESIENNVSSPEEAYVRFMEMSNNNVIH